MTELLSTTETINLPEGYRFVDKFSIKPVEIISLRELVGWESDTSEVWQQCIEQPGIIVGVRDDEGALVGMGRITADPRHAVLCDLAVHPDNRRQGIGRSIVLKRVQIADELLIPYLYTDLAESNPLRKTYEAVGFMATGGGLIRQT